jgi:hypothetical protein
MKTKVLISESDLVELIEKVITEEPNSDKEKSNQRKLNYFKNIFLPRFEEIKKIHGLNFTIELLNNIALEVDEVTED